jgi:formylglycine-generating enzyme required for sulfatase activity
MNVPHRDVLRRLLLVALVVLLISAGFLLSASAQEGSNPETTSDFAAPAAVGSVFINEVVFAPAAGGHEWVELKNGGGAPVSIAGYGLTDEDGNWYRIPAALPPVPAGAFVVVVFDGQGSTADELNFGDNMATLHSPPGMTNVFEDGADQCALYEGDTVSYDHQLYLPLILRSSSTTSGALAANDSPGSGAASVAAEPIVLSFVAWGADPGTDGERAAAAGIWGAGMYKDLRQIGDETPQPVYPGRSLGLVPGGNLSLLDNWAHYQESEATRGQENPVPGLPNLDSALPETIDGATFAVGWPGIEGATAYHFQMDNDSGFGSPEYDLMLDSPSFVPTSPVPDGQNYWRVAVVRDGQTSSWSTPLGVNSITLPAIPGAGAVEELDQPAAPYATSKRLNITWQLQRKDTRMVCREGDNETGNASWDAPHDETARQEHGINYCERASVSMLASYYGGRLSQDRIAYHDYAGTRNDLGHELTNEDIGATLTWAKIPYERIGRKPTFTEVKTWLDNNRPFISLIYPYTARAHFRVVDGYMEFSFIPGGPVHNLVHLLDPWTNARWVLWDSDPTSVAWVGPSGPGGAPNVLSDEDSDHDGVRDTMDDSDGDGLVDFDERERFQTKPDDPDTDDDGVPDKADMREYVFNTAGQYSRRAADWDGDGTAKERDPDNDRRLNNGSYDGCEDGNHNGKQDAGETSNFNPGDERAWLTPPTVSDMELVPAGSFFMGCDPAHNGGFRCGWGESPLRSVHLSAYRIDRTEVTNAQYAECVAAGRCTPPADNSSQQRDCYYYNPAYASYPVVRVNWYQASAYCAWVGKRLPTEAEWEKAARGPSDTRAFPWGDTSPTCALTNLNPDLGPLCVGDTSAVGSYPAGASPYGTLDMAGNVWEWVNDWYQEDYYSVSPGSNPLGPATGTVKVFRGGDWGNSEFYQRVADRGMYGYPQTDQGNSQVGFRCAAAP